MFKRGSNFKLILVLLLILSSLLLLASCKQSSSNLNKNNSTNNLDTLIGPANLTNDMKNLIKIGGTDNFYVFEIRNQKESYKSVSCWVDLYEDGKVKTTFGKMTSEIQEGDKVKYISIALNKSSVDNSKRELIMSIISNNGVAQGRTIDEDEVDPKLSEASSPNEEQKFKEGQDIDLAVFIQNQGSTSVFNSISENMKELLKNKRLYIFKCKVEK